MSEDRRESGTKRTLVLGAGFGGLSVATSLRDRLRGRHEVVLIDRREEFVMGLRKLWALFGTGTLEEGRRRLAEVEGSGIRFLRREVLGIDGRKRCVTTDEATLNGDYLVIALGAEPRPDLVPGLMEHGHDLYDVGAIPELERAIAKFAGGRIAIVIAGVPYKCPPAPYECAMLLDAHLRERGIRDRTEIRLSTVQPMLLPNVGEEGSAWIAEQLRDRGIDYGTGRKVERVEADRVIFQDSALEFDLLIGVPPHRPPRVVKESGLTDGGEWIQVDPGTLETGVAGVYAIGDVTQITLANGLPLPKAGVMAEAEGERVAAAIAADVLGLETPPPFDGQGYCFMELGPDRAALIEGDFFARPQPRVTLGEVSATNASAKREFEAERLRRWFGG